jgi:hypothetical protein
MTTLQPSVSLVENPAFVRHAFGQLKQLIVFEVTQYGDSRIGCNGHAFKFQAKRCQSGRSFGRFGRHRHSTIGVEQWPVQHLRQIIHAWRQVNRFAETRCLSERRFGRRDSRITGPGGIGQFDSNDHREHYAHDKERQR